MRVAPRETLPRVLNSRVLRPSDDAPACWAVVCFYVLRSERRGGVAAELLEAVLAFAAERAAAVEGYPKDTEGAKRHANEMFVGSMSMFAEAGFTEAARRSLPHSADHAPRLGGRGGPAGSR